MPTNHLAKLDRENIEDILALTPMQEGMLFHYLKDPESDAYFEQLCLDISGEIHKETFEQAWNFVIETNEMLRTVFRWDKVKNPVQVVLKTYRLKPGYHTFSKEAGSKKGRKQWIEEIKNRDIREKFDLQQVPFRVTLCQTDEKQYQLIISYHHILFDGWSSGIILQEFLEAYKNLSRQKPLPKPVKNKFKVFVQCTRSQDENEQADFWRDHLKGLDALSELSIKKARKVKDITITGTGVLRLTFGSEMKEEMERFVKTYKVTLASLFYCAWGLLLQKYNNSDDVIFGTTVSGRTVKVQGIEQMVGLFINTLPLRIQSYTNENLGELLHRLHQTLRLREPYESTSLVLVNQCSEMVNKEKLFDSIFVMENYPLGIALNQKGNQSSISVDSYAIIETTHYDLSIGAAVLDEGIELTFTYNKEMFDEDTVVRLSDHFRELVQDIAANPHREISEIEIISEQEKNRILYEFNNTTADFPRDKTLHQLFEEQAQRTPDGIAIHMTHRTYMTYDRLNRKSNQLAHYLHQQGAKANHLVGIITDRSLEMIVGMLGILKAGCGYIPLDPKAPEARMDYILQECDVKILLSKVNKVSGNIEVIDLSNVIDKNVGPSAHQNLPTHLTHPTQLCYVIYTSGSTGKPKGVLISHANLSPLLHWGYRHLGLNAADRIIQNLAYYFDWSVWEIFITLTSGASLFMVPEDLLLNPEASIAFINENDITVLHVTPSQYRYYLAGGLKLETLRYLFIGAEALSVDLVKRSFDSVHEHCRVFNMYGPTEATIIASVLEIDRANVEKFKGLSSVPIGRPVANTDFFILDKYLKLCPVNVTGELYIGGDGLSSGYLNNPELTAEKFNRSYKSYRTYISYRTGDLVRWLPDGNIEFLGRIDHQVKVRGFRIELGEVESMLSTHEAVKEAVVMVREASDGGKYLCAYIIPHSPHSPIPQLRDYLSGKLPEYMIPSYFVELDNFPLTSSGKIDRKALPVPDEEAYVGFPEYAAPRSETEWTLAAIWSELLGIPADKIGIDANFFALGGHSLKVTKLAARVHRELQVKIPLSQLFERLTIQKISQYMESLGESRYIPITHAPPQEYYDLSYAQRRLWIICQFEEDSVAYNEVGGLTITGKFNPGAFEQAIQLLTLRHQCLRTVFKMVDGGPKQKIIEDLKINLDPVDLRHLEGAEQKARASEIIKATANKAFDLEKGPLVVFKLLQLEEEKYFLLVNIHHIINDGWSVGIIRNELNALYHFFNNKKDTDDQAIPLPEVTFQYKDYTLWHNRLIDEGYFDRFKDYWLEKFQDKPTGIELPLDHPRGAVQTFKGGRVFYTIPEAETSRLAQLCPEQDATLFMKLLTLLDILLYKYTGEKDIIVGSPIAGRKQPELYSIIGFLVNTLVYRTEVNPDESFGQLLKKVKQETLLCYENQDYPFDILVESLGLDRDLSRSPLFNVMLAFGNADTRGEELRFQGAEVVFHDQVEEFNPSVIDLVFFFNEKQERIAGEIMYNSDLFERSTIERMAKNILVLLEHILEHRDKPVSGLECIDKREYERIIYQFNDNREDFPELTIQELVQNQVEQSLDKIAVVSPGGEALTYRELNRRANQLAYHLREAYAIGPGHMVGICIDRCLEMVTAILGVVKAGAGYVAIDPNYPRDRVQHMIEDSRTHVVLIDIQRPLLFDMEGGEKQQLVNVFSHWGRICPGPDHNPEVLNNPADIVYVIYTSGSTGMPNGAMLSHAILSNLIQWQANKTSIDTSRRCLQFTSINFCVSFQEIFITLACGGEVHLIGDIERQDTGYLMDFLVRRRIENLYLPFSYLNFLFNLFTETDMAERSLRTSLKHIITAGEQLKITSGLKKFLEQNPGLKLHNHYGSSEMHVVTSYTLDASTASRMPVPPAGKPISNTRIYILDEYENPVPMGVWGELFVDGCVEISGYIHNPVLTEKKLLDHPVFSSWTGSRLYRSGDLGRWMEDGNIELKGRKDLQVKIRGFRVEPSEIESKILSLEKVKDCVVVVKDDAKCDKVLVAYVVGEGIRVSEIKDHIKNYLPQYMIPKFVMLESLPLMPNGKVDREQLPEPLAEIETLEITPEKINALLQEEESEDVKKGKGNLENLIARLTRHIREQLFHRPIKVSAVDIEVFSESDKEQLLWDGKTIAKPIHQLFEKQVAQTPDRIAAAALSSAHRTYRTYTELNKKSNQLAQLLQSKGVTRDSVVGVMFHDVADMIIAGLGVLKAGGSYLAIAPATPPDTITAMLEENKVSLLLTHSRDIGTHSFTILQGLEAGRKEEQKIHVTGCREQIMDFDRLPIPDRSLVNYDRYGQDIGLAMVKNTISLQASRGCPYNCLYCHKIWPKRHVFRSAENIYREVELYHWMGVRRFVFVDDIFNLDAENSRRFFQRVIKNRLDANFFFPNGLRSDILTRDYIDLMVAAGTVGVGMALETASPRLQRLIRKNMNLDKLRDSVEYLCQTYPQVILELFLMHGFPTETEEEALMTLEFLKNLHWVDFPYFHILKIFPNTDMAAVAVENGISPEAISRSANLAFHELPETLPFDKSFTLKCQAEFANDYFLLKERLLAKLPLQMRVLTPDEIVEKYNSYLPVEIKRFSDLLDFVGISAHELGIELDEEGNPVSAPQGLLPDMRVPGLFLKMQSHFPQHQAEPGALRVLLLDLSQYFSWEREILYDGVEPPLGLMYLLTYLNRQLAGKINGKIAKSRVDFDNYGELKALLEEFKPQVIGMRTLTYYADFFHKTAAMIRQWGVDVPIIAGGPYATSDYRTILQDAHVNLVVLSEGELTFVELIRKVIENGGQLPGEEELKKIAGIAFIPHAVGNTREVLLLDGLNERLNREQADNPEPVEQPGEPVHTGLAASYVCNRGISRLLATLLQGGSLCEMPEEIGKKEIEGVESFELYYDDAHQEGDTFHIRVKLREGCVFLRSMGESFENEVEEKLADIWVELLGIEKGFIGRDDNFFEVGGHSLKATTLMTRIHKEFNTKIKLIEIFKNPTIREIASLINVVDWAKQQKKDISRELEEVIL